MRSMRDILGNEAEFCLDLKQSLRCGYDPFDLIEEFSDNIKHYHISDHSISSDCLLPGDGGFDFERLFNVLDKKKFNGTLMIEVYKDCYKSYESIFDSFRNLKNCYCNILKNNV